jgi:hypothetical protein
MIGFYGSYTASFVSFLGVAKFKPKCDPYAVVPTNNDVNEEGTGTDIGTTGTGTSNETKQDITTGTGSKEEMKITEMGKV